MPRSEPHLGWRQLADSPAAILHPEPRPQPRPRGLGVRGRLLVGEGPAAAGADLAAHRGVIYLKQVPASSPHLPVRRVRGGVAQQGRHRGRGRVLYRHRHLGAGHRSCNIGHMGEALANNIKKQTSFYLGVEVKQRNGCLSFFFRRLLCLFRYLKY